MFRLESYITPILLNYVAKYVKNLRPEDAQLSLWEGEVTFHNLELNLEVLQKELNLPVEFISGHLHDLSILVPWTKITSEPVRITINTIEFVLKLKERNATSCSSSATSSPQRQKDVKNKTNGGQEQAQAAQYFGTGLVNKIINNIVINCHNIILKYIEEDIVVSMNVQLLSFESANEKWEPAMVDLHPVKVILRKLITISDLTICLDKRNEAGRIDVSQEPILYRCTLECRILRKHLTPTAKTTSVTRIAVLTKSMDINVSSLQFPMAIRLYEILQCFKNCEPSTSTEDITEEQLEQSASISSRNQGSVLSWAWHMLPNFSLEFNEEQNDAIEIVGHYTEFSLYMEDFNFTLKHSEFIAESIMTGAKRIRYSPIVRVHLSGIYLELVKVNELQWFNIKGGISSIHIEPLGAYRVDEKWGGAVVESPLVSDVNSFKDKSLFDENFPSGDSEVWNVTNLLAYRERFTDEYLCYRSPVFVFDIIEYIALPQQKNSVVNLDSLNDLDTATLLHSKNAQYRLMASGIKISYTQALQQVGNVISEYIKCNDSTTYHTADKQLKAAPPTTKLHPPLMEDYDALMQHIPRCTYAVRIRNLILECHAKMEPEDKSMKKIPPYIKPQIPYFQLSLREACLQLVTPLLPEKLVHTTCQLPKKPPELLNACNDGYQLDLYDLELFIKQQQQNKEFVRLLHMPEIQLNYGSLLMPNLWAIDHIALQKAKIMFKTINLNFSKRQLILMQALINCILSFDAQSLTAISQMLLNCEHFDAVRLQTTVTNLQLQFNQFHTYTLIGGSVKNLQMEVLEEAEKYMLLNSQAANNWLQFFVQLPAKKETTASGPLITLLWIDCYQIYLDQHLLKFLSYEQPTKPKFEREISVEPEQSQTAHSVHSSISAICTPLNTNLANSAPRRRISRSSQYTRKLSHPEETVHYSSERDERPDIESSSNAKTESQTKSAATYFNLKDFVHNLVLQIELKGGKLNLAENFVRDEKTKIVGNFTLLALPRLIVKCPSIEFQKQDEFLRKLNLQVSEKEVSWVIKLSDLGLFGYSNSAETKMIQNAQTTITVAFMQRTLKVNPTINLQKTKDVAREAELEEKSSKMSVKKPTNLLAEKPAVQPSEHYYGSDNADSGSLDAEAESDANHSPNESAMSVSAKKFDISKISASGKSEQSGMCINLHADTPPLHVEINARRLPDILNHFNILLNTIELLTLTATDKNKTVTSFQAIQIVSPTEANASIKEFMDMDSNSEVSVRIDNDTEVSGTSVFCQWTVAKISAVLVDFCELNKSKIALELEDLLATVDQHDTYTKCTGKIGQFNLGYYEKTVADEWKPKEHLQIKVLSELSGTPFLNVIMTSAGLRDYYRRVGIKRNGDTRQNITEIIIDMMALEMTIDMEKLSELMQAICTALAYSDSTKKPQKTVVQPKAKAPMTSQTLPILHFNSKGFTFYMPTKNTNKYCSVLIFKIDSIRVTPNLENPLQRIPVRTDVFYKAAQMGILGLPGASVEDRQYELTLLKISAATGNWEEILTHFQDKDSNFLSSNPAFEWNNQNRRTQVQLNYIFSDFTFTSIYAPYITYNNVLICGQALEFNCTNDFLASINVLQLQLMTAILNRVLCISKCTTKEKANSEMSFKSVSEWQSSESVSLKKMKKPSSQKNSASALILESRDCLSLSTFDAIEEDTELKNTDSGIQSGRSTLAKDKLKHLKQKGSNSSLLLQQQHQPSSVSMKPLELPNTISFVAGIFLIKLYDVKFNSESDSAKQTFEEVPLFSVTLTQPSFMLNQNIKELSIQMSIFDFTISSANGVSEFPDKLFSSKQVELAANGIPPPLLTFKLQTNASQLKEVDIVLSKHIYLTLNEKCILKLTENILLLYGVILEQPCFSVSAEVPIVRGPKLKLLRLQFFDADRLNFKCQSMSVNFEDRLGGNCKFKLMETRANVKFITRPEKAVFAISFDSFYFQADQQVILHPVSLRLTADLVSEPWHDLPLMNINANINVLHLDVGILSILRIKQLLKELEEISLTSSKNLQNFLLKRHEKSSQNLKQPKLEYVKCASLNTIHTRKCDKLKQREEYYQDDLRAGAFQFVELTTDTFLPLPYQIQIIKKNFGIICWRYPQPRKMSKIMIYPILMQSARPIQIKCSMEYFSDVHENFLPYCDFVLSETEMQEIEQPKRSISANIWRVVILQSVVTVNGECFDTSEEDEDLKNISNSNLEALQHNEFVLHPRALVACMRVDTCFHSNSVAKCQFLLNCNMLQLKLLNQTNFVGEMPSNLKGFQLTQVTNQEFFSLEADAVYFHANFYATNHYEFESNLQLSLHCLDQGYLLMLPLLERSKLSIWLHMNRNLRQAYLHAMIDKLHLHVGAAMVHTLYASKMHWEAQLNNTVNSNSHIMLTKCIVANHTYTPLMFGQTATNQRIALGIKQCHMYSFLSAVQKQELTFYILNQENNILEVSQSVHIQLKLQAKSELKSLIIGAHCLLLKCTRLSATQVYVAIKGQIELISKVQHNLRVEFVTDNQQAVEKTTTEYLISKEEHCTFYQYLHSSTNICMRLKFSTKGKGRTGDIPLKTNKNLPWLVKVPTQNNEFISFWVRVLREDIQPLFTCKFQPQRILITIWPIFEINSLLASPIHVKELTTQENYVIEPVGNKTQLSVPATHLTDHELTFDYGFPIDKNTAEKYILTLKSLNWNRFFWYDEQVWTIEHAIEELSKENSIIWPCNDEEELRLNRPMKLEHSKHARSITHSVKGELDFSCSLPLVLAPWGLFVNATGMDITICNANTKECTNISANCIEMLGLLEPGFTISLANNGISANTSQTIYFAYQMTVFSGQYLVLSEHFSLDILLMQKDKVYNFVLSFHKQHEQRILKLAAKFVICNLTKEPLYVLPFAMDHKERGNRAQIIDLNHKETAYALPCTENFSNAIGQSLDAFYDLKSTRCHTVDTAFVFFVCIKADENSTCSIPISLALPFTRRCFSIQKSHKSIPLAATLMEKEGVYYLSIFENVAPTMLVYNQTDVSFILGHTDAPEHAKVTKIYPEYEGQHFEWYENVPSQSQFFYTPALIHSHFPDVDFKHCNISLSVSNENNCKNLHWSKALRIDKSDEKFLHIPKYGDVKVTVCDNHRIVHVYIYYLAEQSEFSVKDLRLRLLMPTITSPTRQIETVIDSTVSQKSLESVEFQSLTSQDTQKCRHFNQACETKLQWHICAYIQKTVLGLFTEKTEQDFLKNDVMALYIDDFVMQLAETDDDREVKLHFMNVQIDNQIFCSGNYDFPVILCAQELYSAQTLLPQIQWLDLFCQQLETNQKSLLTCVLKNYDDAFEVRQANLNLSPIRTYIEDGFLNALLDNLLECVPSNCVYLAENNKEKLTLQAGQVLIPREITNQALVISQPLQVRSLRIEPLKVLLSVHTSVRLYIALDHSPLSFNAYERQQLLTVPLRLGQSLGLHYLSGAIFGAGWVVGSLEILGSPSGLARSVTTGLKDFVSMPVQGLLHGPWDFIMGFTQGTSSLLRNVTAGTVNSVTKLASSVARNLDRLSLDQEHIARTEALRRCRPQGFADGFSQGITGLGISILGAVGGIAHHTLEANTPVQVMTGMGKGLMGALTKPLSGAAELVALAGQGMLHAVGFNIMPAQRVSDLHLNDSGIPSAYRLWSLMPDLLMPDQILFHYTVSLNLQDRLVEGFVYLTAAVFVLMEGATDKPQFILPINKVDIYVDSKNKGWFHVRLLQNIEEDINYTNQRIMNFLNSSNSNSDNKSDSLQDLVELSKSEMTDKRNINCSFYLNEHLGQHIIEYLKVMNRKS